MKPETRPGILLETARLAIRRLVPADAPFILELLNDPAYLRWIGDKRVHSLDQARDYLDNGPLESYARHGFGLYHVLRRDTAEPVGYCGLLRRDALPMPDLGFATLPAHRGLGFVVEASRAILEHEYLTHGIDRVGAIVLPGNNASIATLERLGFVHRGGATLPPDPTELLWFEGERGGQGRQQPA